MYFFFVLDQLKYLNGLKGTPILNYIGVIPAGGWQVQEVTVWEAEAVVPNSSTVVAWVLDSEAKWMKELSSL